MGKAASISDILRRRLANHQLTQTAFGKPEQVAAWFGAVQAQDYLGALWALGQRLPSCTETEVEAAEARRAIVRLWPMRGTLHFVAAADSRWITELLAPRVIARNAARIKREVDVDARVIGRARDVVMQALQGGKRLERAGLYEALDSKRVRTAHSRGLHILGWLAMEGTLCLAGRSGKQHTFALLDEWIPGLRRLDREAALVEIARRYFTSHGPATQRDFMWWAGITAKDAQAAIRGAAGDLSCLEVEGRDYWWREFKPGTRAPTGNRVRLLPAFDEYTVAYHERAMLAESPMLSKMGLLGPVILVDGRVAGTWKRKLDRGSVQVETRLHRALTRPESTALREAMRGYAAFLGRDAKLPKG